MTERERKLPFTLTTPRPDETTAPIKSARRLRKLATADGTLAIGQPAGIDNGQGAIFIVR
jgi:hypothetical protein